MLSTLPGALDACRQRAILTVFNQAVPPSAPLFTLQAQGPDAAAFLHSQLTSDILALAPGEGQPTARVERTGHLLALASLHRDPDHHDRYIFLVDASTQQRLHTLLDNAIFSDDVQVSQPPPRRWVCILGPSAHDIVGDVLAPIGFEPISVIPENAWRRPTKTRSSLQLPHDTWLLRRSFTGDPGILLSAPLDAHDDDWQALVDALSQAVRARDGAQISPELWLDVLHTARVETGEVQIEDFGTSRRLLPETGLERHTVSYTKGCYLGQEVIARVRTYGSVPYLLRALRIAHQDTATSRHEALTRLPPAGQPILDVHGKKIGVWAARAYSPIAQSVVSQAFLHRSHRVPGAELQLLDAQGAPLSATVALLPLHAAADTPQRVQSLYETAIRVFAEGQPKQALALLEQAIRLDPSFADAYEVIGVMLGQDGHWHEAIDVFRRLEEIVPDEPLVNTNLSVYYMKIGDKATAEDEASKGTLKAMARSRGKSSTTFAADLDASKRKDAARKIGMFQRVLEIDPDDTVALFGLGSALLTLDRAADAVPIFVHAIAVDKNNSAIYLAYGRSLEKLGQRDDAIAIYKQGMEVASRRGDLMPLREMQHRTLLLGAQ